MVVGCYPVLSWKFSAIILLVVATGFLSPGNLHAELLLVMRLYASLLSRGPAHGVVDVPFGHAFRIDNSLGPVGDRDVWASIRSEARSTKPVKAIERIEFSLK
jgi:hypothetical protein